MKNGNKINILVMNQIKPITPKEALEQRETVIHPEIINIVNEFLKKRLINEKLSVVIKQKEIVNEFISRVPDFGKDKLFDEHHMDFEEIYRKQGWSVKYESPCRDESFEEYYEFKIK